MSTNATQKDTIYSDIPISFNIHPIKKDLTRVTNEESVKRSIKNILYTAFYERRFRPRFGANLRRYLFENITPVTAEIIKTEISNAIVTYEPRAQLISVTVSASEDDNAITATIIFSLINKTEPVILTTILALDRVR